MLLSSTALQYDLLKVYEERRKLIPIIVGMEQHGLTFSMKRLKELKHDYTEESKEYTAVCMNLGEGVITKLPKSGTSKELIDLLFNRWKLEPFKVSEKTGVPSLDKDVLDFYFKTLHRNSIPLCFLKNLSAKRKRDTALSYIESYERFGLKIPGLDDYYLIHSSLNPTGQRTLRWSSKNPSEMVISKRFLDEEDDEDVDEQGRGRYEREGKNLRYIFGPLPDREWWSLDYINIELMIPAYESGERKMIELFERPDKPPYFGSYHYLNSHILYKEAFEKCLADGLDFKKRYKTTNYQWAKNTGFARQYNAQKRKIDLTARKEGAFELLGTGLPKITALNEYYVDFAREHGFVWTVDDKENGPYPIQCEKQYNPYSSTYEVPVTVPFARHIQSSASRCLGKAMIRVYDYLQQFKQPHYITINLHDEIVVDFPRGKTLMENLPKIKKVQELMLKSGDDISVPLRTSCAYHPQTWSLEEEIN